MEHMKIELMNKENDFIHHYGVNRGYQVSTQKVDRCLFLSSDAKQLYRNICHYAYGDKRGCYPSQATLRLELGWSRSLMTKTLKELIDKGFIKTFNRGINSPLGYNIVELNQVLVLYHSELVYELKPTDSIEPDKYYARLEKYYARLDEYKKSELFNKVCNSNNPTKFRDEIETWFNQASDTNETLDTLEVNVKSILFDDKAPDGIDISKPKRIEPKIAPVADKILDEKGKPKGEGSKHYSKKDIEIWNCTDFCEYFKDKYNENNKMAYTGNMSEDRIYIKSVIAKRGNDAAKELIELYIMKSDYSFKSVKHFSDSGVQQVLGVLHKTGEMPEFKKKGEPKPPGLDYDSKYGF